MGQLSETRIRAAKPGPKEYFLNDGDNLFLRVRSTGKTWVYRYEKGGKPVKLGLGPYPAVTLAQARAKAYAGKVLRHLEIHVFPWVGDRSIEGILPTPTSRASP